MLDRAKTKDFNGLDLKGVFIKRFQLNFLFLEKLFDFIIARIFNLPLVKGEAFL